MRFKHPQCSKYRLGQVGHARLTISVWKKIVLAGHPVQQTVVQMPTSAWCWYSYVGYTGHLGWESMCLWGNTKRKQIGLRTSQGQQKLSTQPWDECVPSPKASAEGRTEGGLWMGTPRPSFLYTLPTSKTGQSPPPFHRLRPLWRHIPTSAKFVASNRAYSGEHSSSGWQAVRLTSSSACRSTA